MEWVRLRRGYFPKALPSATERSSQGRRVREGGWRRLRLPHFPNKCFRARSLRAEPKGVISGRNAAPGRSGKRRRREGESGGKGEDVAFRRALESGDLEAIQSALARLFSEANALAGSQSTVSHMNDRKERSDDRRRNAAASRGQRRPLAGESGAWVGSIRILKVQTPGGWRGPKPWSVLRKGLGRLQGRPDAKAPSPREGLDLPLTPRSAEWQAEGDGSCGLFLGTISCPTRSAVPRLKRAARG